MVVEGETMLSVRESQDGFISRSTSVQVGRHIDPKSRFANMLRLPVPVGLSGILNGLRVVERADWHASHRRRTVTDPKTWTRPWGVAFPLRRDPGYRIFEYACHEGNHAMSNILSASRAEERQGK
jgi:hypothetical protein